jgi:hypothetical protein
MRTAGLVVALGGLLNVAFANVICNSEVVHSKPRIVSAAEKDGFATSIKEVCSTNDSFSESRSGSTVFTLTGTDKKDDCEARFHSIIEQCVAGHNFGGGKFITTHGLTLEVSTTDAGGDHAVEVRRVRGVHRGTGQRVPIRTKRTRTRTQKIKTNTKTKTTHATPTNKPITTKAVTTKAVSTKPTTTKSTSATPTSTNSVTTQPTSCPLPKKKTGIKRFIPDFLLKRKGPKVDASCLPEEFDDSPEFKSLATSISDAKDGEFYKFTSKSRFTPAPPGETPDELKKLQKKLGFNHIKVIVGEVKITKKPNHNGKKMKVTRRFNAMMFDLIKDGTSGAAKPNEEAFKLKKDQVYTLTDGVKTTSAKVGKNADMAKKKVDAYFEDEEHEMYNVDTNNCNTFAQYMMKEV